jgi:hypothetical protein
MARGPLSLPGRLSHPPKCLVVRAPGAVHPRADMHIVTFAILHCPTHTNESTTGLNLGSKIVGGMWREG